MSHRDQLFACTDELATLPETIKALIAWDISGDGRILNVEVADSETWTDAFDECLVATIQKWVLSPPPDNRRVKITIPLELQTAGWAAVSGKKSTDRPAAAGVREMFILGLRPSLAKDKLAAQVVNDLLAIELASALWLTTKIMGDIDAQLRVEQQKDAIGCSDVECAASIGGALGVEMICYGYVATLKAERSISATVVDRDGKVLARSVVLADLDSSTEAAVRVLARELLLQLR